MTEPPFGFNMPGGAPDPQDPQQMARFLAQMQQFLVTSDSGPVNWDLARQVATAQLRESTDQVGTDVRDAATEALRLADLWLEQVTTFPSGTRTTAVWTRQEWLEATLDVWRKLCDPVATRMVEAMTDLVPDQVRAQVGPLHQMLQSIGGALFGHQLGQALASLAGEVLTSSDIGLPVGPPGTAALLPTNTAALAEGLEIPEDEVRLYVALREAAHQRLFGHVPWLRGHVLAAVDAYARGIKVNREAVEDALGRVDPTRPETMQELNIEGVFTPEDSPAQQAALSRLETALALIEGWVTHVVDSAAADRLPNRVKLAEAFRRRRAEGGPAEQTFAALVGLELRPRRLREAARVWSSLTEYQSIDGRDATWDHPDLLPSEEDFADPLGFAQRKLGIDFTDLGDLGFDDPPGDDKTKDDKTKDDKPRDDKPRDDKPRDDKP